MLSETITNGILHVVLISVFIGIFFFTYASRVEQNIVKERSREIVRDITNDIKTFAPKGSISFLGKIANQIQPPDLREEDKEVEEKNKALLEKATKVLAVLFVVGISVSLFLSYKYGFSFKTLLIHNFIILFFVALTEFSFLTFFAQNYITIDSNFVKYKTLDTLIKFGQSS